MAMDMLRLHRTYDATIVPLMYFKLVRTADTSAPTPAATIVAAIGTS